MVLRVAIESQTAVIEGLLDQEVLGGLLDRCRACSTRRLVVRAGTIVRVECVTTLADLGMEVVAESPYLARWLERTRAERRRR